AAPTGGDRGGENRVLEGAGDAVMRQQVLALTDALGEVDSHHEGDVDRLGEGGRAAGEEEGGTEGKNEPVDLPHRAIRARAMRRFRGVDAALAQEREALA